MTLNKSLGLSNHQFLHLTTMASVVLKLYCTRWKSRDLAKNVNPEVELQDTLTHCVLGRSSQSFFKKISPQVILMHAVLKTILSETLISHFFLIPFPLVLSLLKGRRNLIVPSGSIFPYMLCLWMWRKMATKFEIMKSPTLMPRLWYIRIYFDENNFTHKGGFLSCGTVDIWGQMILCRACVCCVRMGDRIVLFIVGY